MYRLASNHPLCIESRRYVLDISVDKVTDDRQRRTAKEAKISVKTVEVSSRVNALCLS